MRRRYVHLLLLMLMLSGAFGRQAHARPAEATQPAQAARELDSESGDARIPPGTIITPISEPSPLSEPIKGPGLKTAGPSTAGGWSSYYGTRGGELTFKPRSPGAVDTPQGPAIGVGGWRSTLPAISSNNVTAIAATGDGRVYMSVASLGLYVYSANAAGAYSWAGIPASGGSTGPANSPVTKLAVFNGQLWVGTNGGGVSVLNLTSGVWITYTTSSTPLLAGNTITSLTPVTPATGSPFIWIGTTSGATRYTASRTPTWQRFTSTSTNGGLSGNNIFDIAVQLMGAVTYTWFSTSNSLVRWNGSTWTDYYGAGGCDFGRATLMAVDNSNALWFGMEKYAPAFSEEGAEEAKSPSAPQAGDWYPEGVCRNFGANWTAYNAASPGLPYAPLSDIDVDGAGRVWMSFSGSSGVGASWDKGRWEIYQTSDGDPLQNNNLSQVEAVGEAIWWGHNGTATVDIFSANWKSFSASDMVGVAGTPGAVLVESSTAWVGVGTRLAWYTSSWNNRTIAGNSSPISALVRDGAGTLWVGTSGSGLFSFDGASTFTPQTTAHGLPSNTIRALARDLEGRLWVATDAGLALRGDSYWLRFTTANAPILSDDLTSLAIDAVGRIWAGTASAGISVFDPRPDGGWTTQTTANGLPSNAIRALLTEPSGAIWAATAAGVAQHDPKTGVWTSYNKAGKSLPSDDAISLAFDGVGTLWVGTNNGLAQLQAGVWSQHHVPGTGLLHDRVRYLGADSKRLWSVSGTTLGVRGPPDVPIGNFAPVISSFTPTQGALATEITISGNYFDNRGPEFNRVTIGDINTVLPIISVSTTSMVVKITPAAKTGKLRVQANGLGSAWSAGTFTVTPRVTDINKSCLGVGSTLELSGYGFTSGNGFYVKLGDGPWRVADYWDPTHAKRVIMPDDKPGAILVRSGGSGPIITTNFTLSMPTLSVEEINIQQGIEDLRMIWGKRTLVQVLPKATGACWGEITGGTLYWKKKDGSELRGGTAYIASPEGLIVKNNPPKLKVDTSVNFVAEFLSNRSNWQQPFPMSQFNGMRIVLKNGWQDVLSISIPASAFVFVDTKGKREIISMGIYPSSGVNEFDFDDAAGRGLSHVARVYPMADIYWGNWLGIISTWTTFDYVYLDDDLDDVDENYGEVRSMAADYVEPGGNRQSMALVDWDLYSNDGPTGKATVGGSSAVTFNHPDYMAQIFLQEAIHNLGWVDDDSPNHDDLNEYHSKYDEGEWDEYDDCLDFLNFRRALEDQMGEVKRVVRIDTGDPYEFSMVGCGKKENMPKSAMSYTTGDRNWNTFIEPVDYNFVLDEICDGECPYSNLVAVPFSPQSLAATEVVTPERTFRLSGEIGSTNLVTVSLSLVEVPGGAPSEPEPGGLYQLMLRDAGDGIVWSHAFNIGADHTHGGPPSSSYFQMRVPFPQGAVKAELRHDNAVIWTDTVSENAPSVSFVSPAGGSHSAGSPLAVSWSSSDIDGDPLQFSLEYSHDGGTTWQLINPKITGNSYQWLPGFATASTSARLRLRASDGFNTATALSPLFTLAPIAPEAVILSPGPGQIFTEGQTIQLSGSSVTSSGPDAGTFSWSLDGKSVGVGRAISTTLEQVGTFTVTLAVQANSLQGTSAVSITVSPDFDHDGLPNAWEQEHKLNPLDPNNGAVDPDGDGLSTLEEYRLESDPVDSDSDDDQVSDGVEAEAGSDPGESSDAPPAAPVLQVGADELGFTVTTNQPWPSPWSIWITNGGTGSLTWSAADDASWLLLSASAGAAPEELSISVDPSGLTPGTYTGHVTITAPGAGASPHVIDVTLEVKAPPGASHKAYLPLLTFTQ